MDMEHPQGRKRHAHQYDSDLTGRTIEFWSMAHQVLEGCDDTRLKELYRRTYQAQTGFYSIDGIA